MWTGHNCCGMKSCGMSGWSIGQLLLQALFQGPAALRSCGPHPDHCPEPHLCVICSGWCLSSSATTAIVNMLTLSAAASVLLEIHHPRHCQEVHPDCQRFQVVPSLQCWCVVQNLKQWTPQVHFLLVRKGSFVSLVVLAFFVHCSFPPWVIPGVASGMEHVWHVLTETQSSAAGQRLVQGLS